MSQAGRETRRRDAGLLRQMRASLDKLQQTINKEALERSRLERAVKKLNKSNASLTRRVRELEKELRVWTTEEVPTLDPEESWG